MWQIKQLGCANFEAIESIGCISKTIAVHFEPEAILCKSNDINVSLK